MSASVAISCATSSGTGAAHPASHGGAPPAQPVAGATGPRRSLFERLGGKPAITAAVDEMLVRVGRDDRINAQFANADMKHLRDMLIDQICEASGGPCRYLGKDMKTTHVGMQISGADFDALVGDLADALVSLKVPATERRDLLGALAPMKGDIVERPAGAPLSGGSGRAGGASPGTEGGGKGPAGDPVLAKARAFRDAAGLLERAEVVRQKPDRSSAELLFSSAELIAGPAAVADVAPIFRDGAPPRITTPLVKVPRDSPAQPAISGSSDEEFPAEPPRRGSLTGRLVLAEGAGTSFSGLAVVGLEPASGKFRPRPPRHRVIEQRNREFAPRLLVVPVGSTVSFPNFDTVFHNVFSRGGLFPFDLGIYRTGEARELTFDKEGIIRIACNLHANMAAYLVVVSSPHYVVADEHGRFAFRNLEPGRYRLRVWTERADAPILQPIEIKANANQATVTVPSAAVAATSRSASGAAPGPGPNSSAPVLSTAAMAPNAVDKFGAPRAARPPAASTP